MIDFAGNVQKVQNKKLCVAKYVYLHHHSRDFLPVIDTSQVRAIYIIYRQYEKVINVITFL